MEMIHNKWFVGFPFSEEWLSAYINNVKKRYNKYLFEKDYLGAIFCVERPYRTQELCDLLPKMSPKDQWEAIKEVYIDCEKPSVNVEFWHLCFTFDHLKQFYEKSKEPLFTAFRIYRGMSKDEFNSNKRGISWTLSKEKAQFFATRFKLDGVVDELFVNRADVACFIPDRNEQEIIYFSY